MEYMILDVPATGYVGQGESTLKGFDKKIEVLSYSWNVSNPIQSSPSNVGRTTGRPNFGELVITKKLDLCSPLFAYSCAAAEPLGTVKLILVRQDLPAGGAEGGTGANLTYMVYTLANALVSSVSVGGGGDIPIESITLNYSAIECKYVGQKVEMSQELNMPKGWDLATNTPWAAPAAAGA
jgi:type VI secretion system secreted protein Hcp